VSGSRLMRILGPAALIVLALTAGATSSSGAQAVAPARVALQETRAASHEAADGRSTQGLARVRPDSALTLPRIPWEGGPEYYARFSKARASGWSSASFFPIAVFYGKPAHARSLRAVGINTYMGAEADGSPLASITRTGMFVLPQRHEWTPSEVGSNAMAVGWHVHDECEMGYSGCVGDEHQRLAQQEAWVRELRSRNDGRFLQANFGNGVLGSFWARSTFHRFVQGVDVSSVDKYAYTSPDIWWLMRSKHHAPHWPRLDGSPAPPARSATYGWLADRMRTYQDPKRRRPVWVFVETAQPFLTEPGARTITPAQIEGAVWSAIIHEARGIAYFQHNNNGLCGVYSIVECGRPLRSKLTAIHAKIRSLARVINTQSYRYDFAGGADTMLKVYGGHAYIFAGIGLGQTPGTKTFTLPDGVRGSTVAVVGERRRIPVVGRGFTDRFAHEYTHRVYRIALAGGASGRAPANAILPAISGDVRVGRTLTASPGKWSGSPTSYAYQWRRCSRGGGGCVNIPGARRAKFRVSASDEGSTLRVLVTASRLSGSSTRVSRHTAPVRVDACPLDQFRTEFFNNVSMTGAPVFVRCDRGANWDWGTGSPAPGVAADRFSARLVGRFTFPTSGVYTFTATADDGVRVYVNGSRIIDGWVNQSGVTYTGRATLPAGRHEVRIEYYDAGWTALLRYSVSGP
jgi:hypothetical protein